MDILYSQRSKYQHIMITQQGKDIYLRLNGVIQCALTKQSHWNLMCPVHERDVTVFGGGSLTGIKPLIDISKSVIFVEIDEAVPKACYQFIPIEYEQYFIFQDCHTYLENNECDHLIISFTDFLEHGAFVNYSLSKFIKLISKKANTFFIHAGLGNQGLLTCFIIKQFIKNINVLLSVDNQVYATNLATEQLGDYKKYLVTQSVSVRDPGIFQLTTDEQAAVCRRGI